jgi:hypothetical protein
MSVGDITGRIMSQGQEKWGRWTSQSIRDTGTTNVTIISAYQVVSDNPNIGTATASAQQRSFLLQTSTSRY